MAGISSPEDSDTPLPASERPIPPAEDQDTSPQPPDDPFEVVAYCVRCEVEIIRDSEDHKRGGTRLDGRDTYCSRCWGPFLAEEREAEVRRQLAEARRQLEELRLEREEAAAAPQDGDDEAAAAPQDGDDEEGASLPPISPCRYVSL